MARKWRPEELDYEAVHFSEAYPHLRVCRRCGDRPDPDHPGLGVQDQGHPGGMGACGDLHDWGPPPGPDCFEAQEGRIKR